MINPAKPHAALCFHHAAGRDRAFPHVALPGSVRCPVIIDRGVAAASNGSARAPVLRCPPGGRGESSTGIGPDRLAGRACGVRTLADVVDLASTDGCGRNVGPGAGQADHDSRCGGQTGLVAVGGLLVRSGASARHKRHPPHGGLMVLSRQLSSGSGLRAGQVLARRCLGQARDGADAQLPDRRDQVAGFTCAKPVNCRVLLASAPLREAGSRRTLLRR